MIMSYMDMAGIFFSFPLSNIFLSPAKNLVDQLAPLGVSNGDVQGSNPPHPYFNYMYIYLSPLHPSSTT